MAAARGVGGGAGEGLGAAGVKKLLMDFCEEAFFFLESEFRAEPSRVPLPFQPSEGSGSPRHGSLRRLARYHVLRDWLMVSLELSGESTW